MKTGLTENLHLYQKITFIGCNKIKITFQRKQFQVKFKEKNNEKVYCRNYNLKDITKFMEVQDDIYE
jgi:hypothetical protein